MDLSYYYIKITLLNIFKIIYIDILYNLFFLLNNYINKYLGYYLYMP